MQKAMTTLEQAKQIAIQYPEHFSIVQEQIFVLVGKEGSTCGGQCGSLVWDKVRNDEEGLNLWVREIQMYTRGDDPIGIGLSAKVFTENYGWRDLSLQLPPNYAWEQRWGDGIIPPRPV